MIYSVLLLFQLFIADSLKNKFSVDSIIITGNKITKDFVINRELLFTNGDSINLEDLETNRKRLESLGIFTGVIINKVKKNIYIKVNEKFPYFLAPTFEVLNQNFNKKSYGLSAGDFNFRGERVNINTFYQNGYRKSFQFRYSNPWVAGNLRLFYSLNYQNSQSEMPKNEDILYTFKMYSLEIGKGFGPYIRTSTRLEFLNKTFNQSLVINTEEFDKNEFENEQFRQFFNIIYDERDDRLYPLNASVYEFSYWISRYEKISSKNYDGLSINFKNFQSVKNITYAVNIKSDHRFSDTYDTDKIQFGENQIIRGDNSFKREYGSHLFVVKQEIRYMVFRDMIWSLNLPYFSEFTQNMRTSIFAYTFLDLGQLYIDKSDLFNSNLYHNGYGLGIGIILPYVNRMSIELSTNGESKSKIRFNLGSDF